MDLSQEKQEQSSQNRSANPQSDLIELVREFNVPVEKLFSTFTNPEELKVWWWPQGLFTDQVDMDFREGGKYFINMKSKIGGTVGGDGMTGEFKEIVPNERIVFTDYFANKNGEPISAKEAGMQGEWPEMVVTMFEFQSLSNSSSQLTLNQEGIPTDFKEECMQGWVEMFDKLDSFLNEQKH